MNMKNKTVSHVLAERSSRNVNFVRKLYTIKIERIRGSEHESKYHDAKTRENRNTKVWSI